MVLGFEVEATVYSVQYTVDIHVHAVVYGKLPLFYGQCLQQVRVGEPMTFIQWTWRD